MLFRSYSLFGTRTAFGAGNQSDRVRADVRSRARNTQKQRVCRFQKIRADRNSRIVGRRCRKFFNIVCGRIYLESVFRSILDSARRISNDEKYSDRRQRQKTKGGTSRSVLINGRFHKIHTLKFSEKYLHFQAKAVLYE